MPYTPPQPPNIVIKHTNSKGALWKIIEKLGYKVISLHCTERGTIPVVEIKGSLTIEDYKNICEHMPKLFHYLVIIDDKETICFTDGTEPYNKIVDELGPPNI